MEIAAQPSPVESEKKPNIFKKWVTGNEGEYKFLLPNYICFGQNKTPKVYDYGKARCYVKKATRILRWAAGIALIVSIILFMITMVIDIDYVITGAIVIIIPVSLLVWLVMLIIDRGSKEESIYKWLIGFAIFIFLVWIGLYFLLRT